MNPQWYRNAVIYQIDPSLFRDSNGDGHGDLAGVTERLEYVKGLGANCIWLLPIYCSPFRDHGYDVSDHLAVDPRFGDLADVVNLLEKAEELGLHVLLELVVQHTSTDHRWFQEARRDRNSPYRDYYVWVDEPEEGDNLEPVFPTVEDSVWTWDEEAQQYYRHMFYAHEPDLNLANPRVREEVYRIMGFWLRLGVSGFRVDAVPYMIERARLADPRHEGYWLLEDMRHFVALRRPEAVLMGEVDVDPEHYSDYFGRGDRLTLLLNFWVNNHLFLSLARGDAEPLMRSLREHPEPPGDAQYALWLRNHDELDLGRLTDEERQEVIEVFAPQENMRAYGRGIRRRVAPMLEGDERRLEMLHSILFALPGTPILRYGEEIGMGDDLSLPERHAVRTPMQWSDAPNAGFSEVGDPDKLPAPVIDDEQYGYRKINAHAQLSRADSLLNRTREMARVRLTLREIGYGQCRPVEVDSRHVVALRHDDEKRSTLMLANLRDEPVEVQIDAKDYGNLVDLLADDSYDPPPQKPLRVRLNGYGWRWLCRREELFG